MNNVNNVKNDIENVKAVVDKWLASLDSGNIEGMLDTCDAEVVVANERQPTTVGIQAIRDKYAPRIEASTFRSGFNIQHTAVYGDLALVIGHFDVEATNKKTGEKGGGSGRLAITYRRHDDGSWKMILDMDNND
jgi:ketosteroid isomerase-like protein